MSNRIEIPVGNGMKMVAEQNSDPNYARELYIGIEDADGSWIQDLACIANEYKYNNDGQVEWSDGIFRVIVWASYYQEDSTDEFTIRLREDV